MGCAHAPRALPPVRTRSQKQSRQQLSVERTAREIQEVLETPGRRSVTTADVPPPGCLSAPSGSASTGRSMSAWTREGTGGSTLRNGKSGKRLGVRKEERRRRIQALRLRAKSTTAPVTMGKSAARLVSWRRNRREQCWPPQLVKCFA